MEVRIEVEERLHGMDFAWDGLCMGWKLEEREWGRERGREGERVRGREGEMERG